MERSPETFAHHLERIRSCGHGYLHLISDGLLGTSHCITPLHCGSSYCQKCRKSALISLRKRLYDSLKSDRWRLVTLTWDHSAVNRIDLLRSCAHTFDKFSKRIHRRYPTIKWARAVEVHQSGYVHIHLIINRYMPLSVLTEAWHAVGGGNADIQAHPRCTLHGVKGCKDPRCKRRPLSYKHAAKYLTEELDKCSQDPHSLGLDWWMSGRRAFACSRNLKLHGSTDRQWRLARIYRSVSDVVIQICTNYNNQNVKFSNGTWFIGQEFSDDITNAHA